MVSRAGGRPALAGVILSEQEESARVLAEVARVLKSRGLVLAGLIQETEPLRDRSCCPAMFVRDLNDGTQIKISEDRGAAAKGCRLDWGALTKAAVRVNTALSQGADMLLINRFGKAEMDGRGLREPIEHAVEIGIPVIVGVRPNYLNAWTDFHGGLAVHLAPDARTVVEWVLSTT